jgi:hypothetical protein
MAVTQDDLQKLAGHIERIKAVAKSEADEACEAGDKGNAKAWRLIEARLAEVLAFGQDIILGGVQPRFGGKRRP